MRELNECTAEVFRRSEQRIKERRKKRGRVLALCIPICLAAAVWSVIIFPPMMLVGEPGDRAQVSGEAAGNAPESPACPYAAVEIQAAGIIPEHREEVTDRLAVAEMFCAVNLLFADDVGGNLPAAEANENSGLSEPASEPKGYTITFTAEDGSQAVYHLSENTLVNAGTNETVFLSDDQAAELLAALGISK